MSHLSVGTSLAVMSQIAQYASADFDSLGILPQDYDLAHGDAPWIRDQRLRVVKTLEALMFGTLDVMGVSRFALPAEYVAAIIATFVSPCNRMVACQWIAENGSTIARAQDLAAQGIQASQVDKCQPSKLFALVCLLTENDASTEARASFESRIQSRIRRAKGA